MSETVKEVPDPLLARAISVQSTLDGAAGTAAPGGASSSAPADAPPALPLEKELAAVAETVGAVLAQFFPSLKPVLTPEKCAAIGDAVAPVLVKYGLEKYIAGLAWRTELKALMVVGPIVLAVKAAIAQDLAAMRARATSKPAVKASPADTVTPGASPAAP